MLVNCALQRLHDYNGKNDVQTIVIVSLEMNDAWSVESCDDMLEHTTTMSHLICDTRFAMDWRHEVHE